jgi:hypothetical protein
MLDCTGLGAQISSVLGSNSFLVIERACIDEIMASVEAPDTGQSTGSLSAHLVGIHDIPLSKSLLHIPARYVSSGCRNARAAARPDMAGSLSVATDKLAL